MTSHRIGTPEHQQPTAPKTGKQAGGSGHSQASTFERSGPTQSQRIRAADSKIAKQTAAHDDAASARAQDADETVAEKRAEQKKTREARKKKEAELFKKLPAEVKESLKPDVRSSEEAFQSQMKILEQAKATYEQDKGAIEEYKSFIEEDRKKFLEDFAFDPKIVQKTQEEGGKSLLINILSVVTTIAKAAYQGSSPEERVLNKTNEIETTLAHKYNESSLDDRIKLLDSYIETLKGELENAHAEESHSGSLSPEFTATVEKKIAEATKKKQDLEAEKKAVPKQEEHHADFSLTAFEDNVFRRLFGEISAEEDLDTLISKFNKEHKQDLQAVTKDAKTLIELHSKLSALQTEARGLLFGQSEHILKERAEKALNLKQQIETYLLNNPKLLKDISEDASVVVNYIKISNPDLYKAQELTIQDLENIQSTLSSFSGKADGLENAQKKVSEALAKRKHDKLIKEYEKQNITANSVSYLKVLDEVDKLEDEVREKELESKKSANWFTPTALGESKEKIAADKALREAQQKLEETKAKQAALGSVLETQNTPDSAPLKSLQSLTKKLKDIERTLKENSNTWSAFFLGTNQTILEAWANTQAELTRVEDRLLDQSDLDPALKTHIESQATKRRGTWNSSDSIKAWLSAYSKQIPEETVVKDLEILCQRAWSFAEPSLAEKLGKEYVLLQTRLRLDLKNENKIAALRSFLERPELSEFVPQVAYSSFKTRDELSKQNVLHQKKQEALSSFSLRPKDEEILLRTQIEVEQQNHTIQRLKGSGLRQEAPAETTLSEREAALAEKLGQETKTKLLCLQADINDLQKNKQSLLESKRALQNALRTIHEEEGKQPTPVQNSLLNLANYRTLIQSQIKNVDAQIAEVSKAINLADRIKRVATLKRLTAIRDETQRRINFREKAIKQLESARRELTSENAVFSEDIIFEEIEILKTGDNREKLSNKKELFESQNKTDKLYSEKIDEIFNQELIRFENQDSKSIHSKELEENLRRMHEALKTDQRDLDNLQAKKPPDNDRVEIEKLRKKIQRQKIEIEELENSTDRWAGMVPLDDWTPWLLDIGRDVLGIQWGRRDGTTQSQHIAWEKLWADQGVDIREAYKAMGESLKKLVNITDPKEQAEEFSKLIQLPGWVWDNPRLARQFITNIQRTIQALSADTDGSKYGTIGKVAHNMKDVVVTDSWAQAILQGNYGVQTQSISREGLALLHLSYHAPTLIGAATAGKDSYLGNLLSILGKSGQIAGDALTGGVKEALTTAFSNYAVENLPGETGALIQAMSNVSAGSDIKKESTLLIGRGLASEVVTFVRDVQNPKVSAFTEIKENFKSWWRNSSKLEKAGRFISQVVVPAAVATLTAVGIIGGTILTGGALAGVILGCVAGAYIIRSLNEHIFCKNSTTKVLLDRQERHRQKILMKDEDYNKYLKTQVSMATDPRTSPQTEKKLQAAPTVSAATATSSPPSVTTAIPPLTPAIPDNISAYIAANKTREEYLRSLLTNSQARSKYLMKPSAAAEGSDEAKFNEYLMSLNKEPMLP